MAFLPPLLQFRFAALHVLSRPRCPRLVFQSCLAHLLTCLARKYIVGSLECAPAWRPCQRPAVAITWGIDYCFVSNAVLRFSFGFQDIRRFACATVHFEQGPAGHTPTASLKCIWPLEHSLLGFETYVLIKRLDRYLCFPFHRLAHMHLVGGGCF